MESFMKSTQNLDLNVSKSTFGRVFRLDGSGHPKERKGSKFLNEIRAGLTTFFTMAYIIAVNASILRDSGATCVCQDLKDVGCEEMQYSSCLIGIGRDMITATAAVGGISSIVFGFLTNLPVAVAPGMGMNAYFTYQVVGYHGTGSVPYSLGLTAVFVEGFIFIALSLIGMRQWLVKLIPSSIKCASGVGIGMFLTMIGMSYSAGIGLVTGSYPTPTGIGGCPVQYLDKFGVCKSHKMTSPSMWIGIMCGGVLTAYLMAYKFKAAIIIGISITSILSWPRNTPFTYFPHNTEGDARFDFFKRIIYFHPIKNTLMAQDWNISAANRHFILALFTFLYVDIIDASATLYSMARFSGVVDPESGDFPRSTLAYCSDAALISIGSLFGCSPVTTFVESGAGIAEGGRTGLTAITTGACFLISLFFAPIFASIPPWATGCTLMLVGCMMMRQVVFINWAYIGDALPAFITIVTMPFTYSVSYGLIAGLFSYMALNILIYLTKKASGDRIEPPDMDNAEYWSVKPGGNPPWFIRVGKKVKHDGIKAWPWKSGDGVLEIQSMNGSVTNGDRELDETKSLPRSREVSYAGRAR
ncbi:xanthine/uracil permease family protein-like protein [Bisporella sp. PMI_857]|nr:xanthine/uracil permease family protein-like protein [Bisporella sp. PMI_857]